jgi:D-alanine-D-alanine ligase
LQGVVRIDYLVSGNKAYLCEVNTVPGSLAYYLFCERITDAKIFFCDLIEEALLRAKDKEKEIVRTGILRKKTE